MKLTSIFSNSTSGKFTITTDDINNFKKTLNQMRLKRACATSWSIITNETIYKETKKVTDRAIPTMKKIIRRGAGHYKIDGKTACLIAVVRRIVKEFENISVMMEIKMRPSKAGPLIEEWIQKALDEAAEAQKKIDEREKENKEEVMGCKNEKVTVAEVKPKLEFTREYYI